MMMMSAGSTLDSTLNSFARVTAQDLGGVYPDGRTSDAVPLPSVAQWIRERDPLLLGRTVMAITVVVGSLPLIAGAEILSATTVSGTMVLGLAPIFVLHRVKAAGPWAFHLAFWPAVAIGVSVAAGWSPAWLAIGEGTYASLLGINIAATVLVVAGFFAGTLLDRSTKGR